MAFPLSPDISRSGETAQRSAAVEGEHVGKRGRDVDLRAALGATQLEHRALQVADDPLAAHVHEDAGSAWPEFRHEVMDALAARPYDAVMFALLTLRDVRLAWQLAHSLTLEEDRGWQELGRPTRRSTRSPSCPCTLASSSTT